MQTAADEPRTLREASPEVRTYRASRGWRASAWLAGLTLGAATPWLLVRLHREMAGPVRPIDWVVSALVVTLGLLGVAALVLVERYRVTLGPHGVIYQGLRRRSVRRADLRGFERAHGQGAPTIRLLSRSGERPLTMSLLFRPDESFERWLAELPDLDQAGIDASARALGEDATLGASPEERAERLEELRRRAFVANGIAALATCLGLFLSWQSLKILLLALPPAVLLVARASRNAVTFFGERNTVKVDFGPALYLPGFALGARTLLDVQVLRFTDLLLPALPILVAFVGAIVLTWRDLRPAAVALLTTFLAGYALGATTLLNASLDRSAPRESVTQLLAKRVQRGRSTTYHFYVPPQPEQDFDGELRVSAAEFDSVPEGGPLCLRFHPGALGVRWISWAPACTSALQEP